MKERKKIPCESILRTCDLCELSVTKLVQAKTNRLQPHHTHVKVIERCEGVKQTFSRIFAGFHCEFCSTFAVLLIQAKNLHEQF